MSLQWTFIASFLYCEIGLAVLFLFPWISVQWWQRIFQSQLVRSVTQYANYYFNMMLALLLLCFLDSIRDMNAKVGSSDLKTNPHAVDHEHMRVFRSQRNFYIAGFSLFLWFVLRRLVVLISVQATTEAKYEAAMKQAQSATDAARKLMAEGSSADVKVENSEVRELEAKLAKRDASLAEKDKELKQALASCEAMKQQAEATGREYDRLAAECQKLERELQRAGRNAADRGGSSDRDSEKDD